MPIDSHRSDREALASRMRTLFDGGVPDVIRQAGSVFTTAEVFDWVKQVHNPSSANVARDKLIALKTGWGLSPSAGLDPNAPQPGRSAELYRGGAAVLSPGQFLPTSEDTFGSWVERTRQALGGDFGMQAPCIECANWDAMEGLRAVLEPTLAITGPRSYRYNVFAGDYRLTPFGYHVDPHHEGVFQVVLEGRRRGRFWEGLALSEDRDDAWVEDASRTPAREPDVVLDLEPGDVVFWPGTQVHGFECEGPSLALSIVIDRAAVRHRHEVESGLAVASMQGAAALPPLVEAEPVTPDHKLRRRLGMRLSFECYEDTLIVGVCGRTVDWPDRLSIPSAIALLQHLSGQDELSAADVAARYATDELDSGDILATLSMLVGFGYLTPA